MSNALWFLLVGGLMLARGLTVSVLQRMLFDPQVFCGCARTQIGEQTPFGINHRQPLCHYLPNSCYSSASRRCVQ